MLCSSPQRAAQNMAIDTALLDRARTEGMAVLRCYSWSRPAVSFGRNERTSPRFVPREIEESGLDAVRRPTGGRALLHLSEVTYSVSMPIDDSVSWRAVFDAVNRRLCAAIRSLGVDARVFPGNDRGSLRPGEALCFAAPSAGEIVVGDAKLVASAVWRERGGFLQQGSIITDGNQDLLRELAGDGSSALATVATLRESARSFDEQSVVAAIREAFGQEADVFDWSSDDALQRDAASRVNHFEDPNWLWRH